MNTYLKKLILLLFSLFILATFSLSDTTMLVKPAAITFQATDDAERPPLLLNGNPCLLV